MRAEFVYFVHSWIPELRTVPALEYHILCQVLSQVLGLKNKQTNKNTANHCPRGVYIPMGETNNT